MPQEVEKTALEGDNSVGTADWSGKGIPECKDGCGKGPLKGGGSTHGDGEVHRRCSGGHSRSEAGRALRGEIELCTIAENQKN